MDPDSPFAHLPKTPAINSKRIYINYCDTCHYIWKAPASVLTCINCKGNGETVRTLVEYDNYIPQT